MALLEHQSDRPLNGQNSKAVLAAVRKDVARRVAGYETVFAEIAETLRLLSNQRILKGDVQFLGLIDAMIGIKDPDVLHDRMLALIAYVNRVAEAHGIAPSMASGGPPNTVVLQQRPSDLADPDDELSQRIRLQVR